jgi:hypothetical protein
MAFHRNSKPDTVFLSDTASSTLAADLSQYGTSLTDMGTYLVSTGTRFSLRGPREIAVVGNLTNAHTGIILNYGQVSGVSPAYRISISAGSVSFVQGASTLATIALPSVGATAASYLLHWSTFYDEVDNVWASELAVVRVASQQWTITRVTHSQPPAFVAGDQLTISGYGAGVSLFSGGLANLSKIRISNRFHSTTEASEDWVVQSSAPSPTGHAPLVELAPFNPSNHYAKDPSGVVSDAILDSGTMAGPAEWLAVLHAGEARQRLYSPLLNAEFVAPPVLSSAYTPSNFHSLEPDATYGNLRYGIQYCWIRPVPFSPSGPIYARVRVQVQCYIAGGAPAGTTARLLLRMLSPAYLDSEPSGGQGNTTALGTCATNHGSAGTGEWLNLGELRIAQSSQLALLLLGYSLGADADIGLTFRRAKIKAIEVEIYSKD